VLTRNLLTTLVTLAAVAAPATRAEGPGTKLPPINKEPAYRSKAPTYFLLVLGAEAKTKVWLVLDGDDLYIDRNANGNLTEDGEKVACKGKMEVADGVVHVYQAGDVTDADGKTKYTQITVLAQRDAEGRSSLYAVSVKIDDRYREAYTPLTLTLGARPDAAPVLHFGGPLTVVLRSTFLSFEETTDLQVMITGKVGEAMMSCVDCASVPADSHPVAEIEFPHKVRDKGPIRVKVVLDQRC
jgi:hypothetical protein